MRSSGMLMTMVAWLAAQPVHAALPKPTQISSPHTRYLLEADCVVIGKVVEVEKAVTKILTATKNKEADCRVIVVKIEQRLLGDVNGLTHVRCAMPVPFESPEVGVAGCFFLSRFQHNKDVFLLNFDLKNTHLIIRNQGEDNAAFRKRIEEVVAYADLLDRRLDALASKEAEERLTTASLLLERYSPGHRNSGYQMADIPIEESKRILAALRDADWSAWDRRTRFVGRDDKLNPYYVFLKLQILKEEGFVEPAADAQVPKAAQEWLRKNADTYRIKRLVGGL